MTEVTSISFNPTATAYKATKDNAADIVQELTRLTGKPFVGGVQVDAYYVAFMGDVYVLTEDQVLAAQGFTR